MNRASAVLLPCSALSLLLLTGCLTGGNLHSGLPGWRTPRSEAPVDMDGPVYAARTSWGSSQGAAGLQATSPTLCDSLAEGLTPRLQYASDGMLRGYGCEVYSAVRALEGRRAEGEPPSQLVCFREPLTGSHISTPTCYGRRSGNLLWRADADQRALLGAQLQ